jgi:hypothetical protein
MAAAAADLAADGAAGDGAQQAAPAGGLGLRRVPRLVAIGAGHRNLLDHGRAGEDPSDFLRACADGNEAEGGEKNGVFHGWVD